MVEPERLRLLTVAEWGHRDDFLVQVSRVLSSSWDCFVQWDEDSLGMVSFDGIPWEESFDWR